MDWQKFVLEQWLGLNDDETWAAPTCGLLVARQNGKSEGVLVARVALGLLYQKERIIFTSHRQDAATEFYNALSRFLDRPEFRRFVEPGGFRSALGRERIVMRNGAFCQFVARSNKGGRAKHSDLLIFDEAQYLDHTELASFTPTQETSKNPQIIYAGTPPDKPDVGGDFAAVRRRALNGTANGIAWCEWAVRTMPEDVTDKRLWYETNPSLGILISEKNIELQVNNLEPDDFAREILGFWAQDEGEDSAISSKKWAACEIDKPPEPAPDERLACGVKFSADGSTYSVSIAAKSKKANYELVECIDRTGTARGVGGLAQWIYDRRHKLATVCVDGRSWAPTLLQKLNDMGYPKRGLHSMRTGEIIDACAMLAGAVQEENVKHIRQPLLAESVSSSPPRPIGREGWGFGGNDPTPVESAAIAFWGVNTTKRNPKRQMKVSI